MHIWIYRVIINRFDYAAIIRTEIGWPTEFLSLFKNLNKQNIFPRVCVP